MLKHTFPCLFCLLSFLEGEVPSRSFPRMEKDQNAIMVVGTGLSMSLEGKYTGLMLATREKDAFSDRSLRLLSV